MIIGTVHIDEARTYNSHKGYHSFHTEESQDEYGSFEVFWQESEFYNTLKDDDELTKAGWYWASGFPSCLYDGDPSGPHASSQQAHEDADEWAPEYDE